MTANAAPAGSETIEPTAFSFVPSYAMHIGRQFDALRERGERALVLFVTAGDPSLEELPEILEALEEGGADLIEIGIPFSDPIADGPTIQASSQRALEGGVTPDAVLEALSACQVNVPIVAMGYYNPILRKGHRAAARAMAAAGVHGVIVSDLTPEEARPWMDACEEFGLDNIFLVAPTSTDERLDAICRCASGFVYAVSRTGVTGAQVETPDVDALVARVRKRTNLPVVVGFGISTPEHVAAIGKIADGVVIGSWLVDWLRQNWKAGEGRAELVQALQRLKASLRSPDAQID